MQAAVQFKDVTKTYRKGAAPALSGFTAEFAEGKIIGLLGRNGAGKTTLINIMTNRVFATSGTVRVLGEDSVENDSAQTHIFCMSEKGGYPADMKVKEGLKRVKGFYPNFDSAYADKLCDLFKLDTGKRIKALSTGYGSIFKLILTLASGAPVMIFDEPVLGLDAGFRDVFYRVLLERFAELQNTVVLSTHLIEEVADIVSDVVILKEGRLIADCPVETLQTRACIISGETRAADRAAEGKKILRRETLGGFTAITVDGRLTDAERRGLTQKGLTVSPAKLQELFISLTAEEEAV